MVVMLVLPVSLVLSKGWRSLRYTTPFFFFVSLVALVAELGLAKQVFSTLVFAP